MSIEPNASPQTAYSANDLVAVTRRWGYRSTIDDTGAQGDGPISSGQLASFYFSSGVRACFSQLSANRTHERDGVLTRSLAIRLVTSGAEHYGLGRYECRSVRQGQCLLLETAGDLHLSNRQISGQSVAGLFVDACPERICDSELAQRICSKLCVTRARPLAVSLRLCSFTEMICRSVSIDPIMRIRIEGHALELLADALECYGGAHGTLLPGSDRNAIRRVCDYILAAPAAEHSLNGLAQVAGMSVSSLKRKFPIATGRSVFEFVRDTRLDCARAAMVSGEMSVKQAAWAAGYAHVSNFSAAYRRKFGRSPRQAVI